MYRGAVCTALLITLKKVVCLSRLTVTNVLQLFKPASVLNNYFKVFYKVFYN